jgi:hypothetical protein
MPSLSFQYNPNVGPLIPVSIWAPNFKPPSLAQASPGAALTMQQHTALIDTGASCTCVSRKVIQAAGLQPSGKQLATHAHGNAPTNAYQFQVVFTFPQAAPIPSGIMQAQIMVFPVNGIEFIPPSVLFDILLGRDVLCRGVFSMSFDGHAIFSL